MIEILIIGDIYNQFLQANATANHTQWVIVSLLTLIFVIAIIAAIVSDNIGLAIMFGLGAALTTIIMISVGLRASDQNQTVTDLSTRVIQQSFVKTSINTTDYQTVKHNDKTTYVINGKTYSINPANITKINSTKNKTSKVELDTVRLKPLNSNQKQVLQKALNYNLQTNSSDISKNLTVTFTSANYTPIDYIKDHTSLTIFN